MNTSPIFLADENIPLSVIKQLPKAGWKIISVTEEFKSSSDKKILELSSRNKWVIITFDKDFGELIYNQNYGNSKVPGLFIRNTKMVAYANQYLI